jgi:hypothetical protein
VQNDQRFDTGTGEDIAIEPRQRVHAHAVTQQACARNPAPRENRLQEKKA